jgi:cobalt/nickel transport system ATP-binding protein
MDAGDALIRMRGVDFAYEPTRPVLRGLDFQIGPGEKVGLLGANGSGKTTLLHVVVGLCKPQAGEVEVFGSLRRRERDFAEVRRLVGITFQDPDDQLFCPTVLEDVAFGPLNLGLRPAEATRAAEDALARVGLDGYADRLTHRLSFGEKKLAALAAVLAMQPRALLLDEPADGLDEVHTGRLRALLMGLPQAMVIASHDRGFLEGIVTRRIRLREGRAEAADQGIAAAPG